MLSPLVSTPPVGTGLTALINADPAHQHHGLAQKQHTLDTIDLGIQSQAETVRSRSAPRTTARWTEPHTPGEHGPAPDAATRQTSTEDHSALD